MKKSIAILAASGLIALSGAAAVSAAPAADATTAPGAVVVTAGESTRSNVLTDVLGELVTDGTITQAQSDKIVSALDARRTELKATREAAREQMIEALADADDDIATKYLDGESISEDEIRSALRRGCIAIKLFPVVCGTAFKTVENSFGSALWILTIRSSQAGGASAARSPTQQAWTSPPACSGVEKRR